MGQLNVSIHVGFQSFKRLGVELGDISAHLEQESVSELECPVNHLLMLPIGRHDFCVTWLGRQVDSQCDQLFTHNRFWTVNYQLIDQGYTLCVGKSCLELILLGKVVEKLEDESSEAWSLQDLDKLWNETLVINLTSNLCIKRQIEQ